MQPRFKPARPLRHYATDLQSWYDGGFLYIPDDDQELTLDTACHLQDWDDLDLSEEEQDFPVSCFHEANRVQVTRI